MSFVGFDLGNNSCVVAVARQRGGNFTVDVLTNSVSNRETPAAVCFEGSRRLFGAAAAGHSTMNLSNTVSKIKCLLGRKFSELQQDLPFLPFKVTQKDDGYPLVHVTYLGEEEEAFTPTQLLGMLLAHLKGEAEKNLEELYSDSTPVQDCCIGIPAHFTDLQRRAVMDAAKIAGLNPLRLLHETTAAALDYSTVLPENEQVNVAFVDMGHASTQVTVAGFKKGELRILSHAFDRSLGGRDFDEVLFRHFAAKIKEKHEIDVYQSPRASFKLRKECQKIKETLTSNPVASLDIDSLMDGKDVMGSIKKVEFEKLSAELIQRLKVPLEAALSDANLSVDKIQSFLLVGAGTRIPVIIKTLGDFFRKEPTRTINAKECVALGCALQCALLNNISQVPQFQVQDSFPLPIALSWIGASLETENGGTDNSQTKIVFPKGNPIPSIQSLTYYGSNTFDVMYADASAGKISTYSIGFFQSSEGELAKVIIKVHLNLHGIFSVESATILEEEGDGVPIEPPKDSTEMDTDEVKDVSSVTEGDVNMEGTKTSTGETGYGVDNGSEQHVEKTVPMEIDGKVSGSKKNVKKTDVPIVEHIYGGMLPEDLQKAVEREKAMAHQDGEMEEIITKRNELEIYAINVKSKLESYQEVLNEFTANLEQVGPLDFGDAKDETKEFYTAKLEELTKLEETIDRQLWHEQDEAQVLSKVQVDNERMRAVLVELRDKVVAGDLAKENLSKVQFDNERMRAEQVELREKAVAGDLAKENLIKAVEDLSKVQVDNQRMRAELVELREKAVAGNLTKENLSKALEDLRKVQVDNEKMRAELELRNAPNSGSISSSVVDCFEQRLRAAEEAARAAKEVANAAVANCNQVRMAMEELRRVPCMNPEVIADLQEQFAAERKKVELEFSAECVKLQNALVSEKREREKLEIEKIFYSSMAIGSSSEKEKELLIQLRKVEQERDALKDELRSFQTYTECRNLLRAQWMSFPGNHLQVQPSQVQPIAADTEEQWTMVPSAQM